MVGVEKSYSKKHLFPAAVIIIAVATIACCSFYGERLVTMPREQLVKVIVIADPNYNGKNAVTVITNPQDMSAIFDAARRVREKTVKYPDHSQSLQFDARYEIQLYYFDSHIDKIYIYSDIAYRFLQTHGGSYDLGYVYGEAEALINSVKQISK